MGRSGRGGIYYYHYSTGRTAVERVHYSTGRSGCRKSPLFHGEVRLSKVSTIRQGGQAAECAAACCCSARGLSACPTPHCRTPQEPLLHLHRDHALFTLSVHRHVAFWQNHLMWAQCVCSRVENSTIKKQSIIIIIIIIIMLFTLCPQAQGPLTTHLTLLTYFVHRHTALWQNHLTLLTHFVHRHTSFW